MEINMKILEKYDGSKTYMFPNGSLATPEVMKAKFPAVMAFAHVIETDEGGEVCFAVENLSALKSIYNIDRSLSENDGAFMQFSSKVKEGWSTFNRCVGVTVRPVSE